MLLEVVLRAVIVRAGRVEYDFHLMSGFREQETMQVQWENIRFNLNVVEMRWKPRFRWMPASSAGRIVGVH